MISLSVTGKLCESSKIQVVYCDTDMEVNLQTSTFNLQPSKLDFGQKGVMQKESLQLNLSNGYLNNDIVT